MQSFYDYVLFRENQNVDINTVAQGLQFLKTSKKKLPYKFAQSDEEMPPMSYAVATQEKPVATVTADGEETTNVAKPNDIIMSGPSNERYVIQAAKFPTLYKNKDGGELAIGETVFPEQSPRMVAIYTGNQHVKFKAPWGEAMVLKPGDSLVKEGEGKFRRIAKKEYDQTYNQPGKIG